MTQPTFRPKKSLGQIFLVDENIARKIIRKLTPNPNDVILEISPGFGVLTKYLIPEVKKIIAVEIDRDLAKKLSTGYGQYKNFELLNRDFLETNLARLTNGCDTFRILGNIPYHITSPVIFKVFENRNLVHDMVLMIQREVAERIVATPGTKEYGILSVFSQLYSAPKILFHVSKNVFKPKPNVASSIVRWDFSNQRKLPERNVELLERLIHVAFQQRRKMLRRSLRGDAEFAEKLSRINLELERRPEDLSPDEFVELANAMIE